MTAKSQWNKPKRDRQSCATCNAYFPNAAANPKSGEPRQGWCRCGPPGLVQVMVNTVAGPKPGTQGAWPTCNSDQWCRAWEPTEDEDERTATPAA